MSSGVRCMWMRGGSSKGGYFLADDLPANPLERDAFLLKVMGSPDPRQIDGMGGADPLTSKVAVVKKSERPNVDIDYLFLQVAVDSRTVSGAQNCGNLLAGVAPFAIERGLKTATSGSTDVTIYMENTGQIATVQIETPAGQLSYDGSTHIDGVPGTAAPILITFHDTAGSSCGALLPTGRPSDTLDAVQVTLIDNGMPTVILPGIEFGLFGHESREMLDANDVLKQRIEAIRLQAGHLMNLGDVSEKTVPKMTLVFPPQSGGTIYTCTFIPHRAHASIGVLGAVSVATACSIPGSVAERVAENVTDHIVGEHPSGNTEVVLSRNEAGECVSAGMLRTARKLMDGVIFS